MAEKIETMVDKAAWDAIAAQNPTLAQVIRELVSRGQTAAQISRHLRELGHNGLVANLVEGAAAYLIQEKR